MESTIFIVFLLCFTYILMPHNMMMLYFRLAYFHVLSEAVLHFAQYFNTLILHGYSLDTFYFSQYK